MKKAESSKRQAELLKINRTSVYRQPPVQKSISAQDLFVRCRIDEIHTAHPTWGYRTIARILKRDDHLLINRKKVRRMMRDMGIYRICLKRALNHRRPEIINSDQGGHFTNPDYLNLLESSAIKISMDGKGQALEKSPKALNI